MTDAELKRERAKMDRLDVRLRDLLIRRRKLALHIIKRKKRSGRARWDGAREVAILRRVTKGKSAPERRYLAAIYGKIFSITKNSD